METNQPTPQKTYAVKCGVSSYYITALRPNEIFVFGSNLAGAHGGGAAALAHRSFGAVMGEGVGRTGQCYAIPTMQGGVDTIRPYVDQFIDYARLHPELRFLVTRIGCGIAGFRTHEIAPLFVEAVELPNVALPHDFLSCIKGLYPCADPADDPASDSTSDPAPASDATSDSAPASDPAPVSPE